MRTLRRTGRFLRGPAAALLLAAAAPAAGVAQSPPPGPELRLEAGVRDPALALLVALVRDERHGVYPLGRIEAEVRRSGRASRIPPGAFRTFTRIPAPGRADAAVILDFPPPREVPVPYDILGYRPGKLRTSPGLRLLEWNLGTVRLEVPVEGRLVPVILEETRVWGVDYGFMEMDIDGWLDALLGSKLDDTGITGLALFRHRGAWIAMAMGYNEKGKGNSGAFSMADDRILFPYPDEYKACGRILRSRIERLLRRDSGSR